MNKKIQIAVFPLCIDRYSLGMIKNPASNPVGSGEIVDKGSKTDSLDDPGDFDSGSLHKRILTFF